MPPARQRGRVGAPPGLLPLPRRILFAIRSKLGDTLISYQCVRTWADAHPADRVTLLTRADYAALLADEPGIRVIGFDSRIAMRLKLWWLRLTEPAFDVLAVLWGSGPPIGVIGRLVAARRKVAWSRRFAPTVFEEAALPADHLLIDPAACTIRSFAPDFAAPRALAIPSLARRREAGADRGAIGVVPIADEARRNLDRDALAQLVAAIRARHPQAPIRLFVNPGNAGAQAFTPDTLPPGCELRPFRDLRALVAEYMQLAAWYGTDTGLYHLAAAIGIPATVFFGPTQPHKIVMPAQPRVRVLRLAALGDRHCEEKACTRPACLHGAIAAFAGQVCATALTDTPAACPLRAAGGGTVPDRLADLSPA